MMHLPGLVLAGPDGKSYPRREPARLAVRGWYGEGSEASGSIFQISNSRPSAKAKTKS